VQIGERSKRVHFIFDSFKGINPQARANDGSTPQPWSMEAFKRAVNEIEEYLLSFTDRFFDLQQRLNELQSSTLRGMLYNSKRENALSIVQLK
jgi:hypothetical protein